MTKGTITTTEKEKKRISSFFVFGAGYTPEHIIELCRLLDHPGERGGSLAEFLLSFYLGLEVGVWYVFLIDCSVVSGFTFLILHGSSFVET